MLKRPITYTDFDGNEVTEEFYFNLTSTELIRLEVQYQDGMEKVLKRIVESKDNQFILQEFEKIILLSYGVKSEDGKRFEKSDLLTQQFRDSAAYDALIMEMFVDAGEAAEFFKAILPKNLAEQAKKVEAQTLPEPLRKMQETADPTVKENFTLPMKQYPPVPPIKK